MGEHIPEPQLYCDRSRIYTVFLADTGTQLTFGEDGMPLMIVLPAECLPFAEPVRWHVAAHSLLDIEISFEEVNPAFDFSGGHRSSKGAAYPRDRHKPRLLFQDPIHLIVEGVG